MNHSVVVTVSHIVECCNECPHRTSQYYDFNCRVIHLCKEKPTGRNLIEVLYKIPDWCPFRVKEGSE